MRRFVDLCFDPVPAFRAGVITGIVLIVAALAPHAFAAPPSRGDFASAEQVLAWINNYRQEPDLARVPLAVQRLAQFGAFKDPDSAAVYVGFIAGVIDANPHEADRLVAAMLPLPAGAQWAVVRAITYSGLPNWKELLRRSAPLMPERRIMIDRTLDGTLPTLDRIKFGDGPSLITRVRGWFGARAPDKHEPSPDLLDIYWGIYFASGDSRAIAQIIAMLPWSEDADNVDRLTLGQMAKFTLASNASRDTDLLKRLERDRDYQLPAIRPVLDEVIMAAETAETAKLRKDALAAIEELKRKGPEGARKLSLWGQIGQGAFALGCIAAAATGQTELGIPCVVGGALSTPVLKYMTGAT